jgi:2-polyprenyl-3-methyl-5-hydroxy-6-metoxy-1,4-benzoquinol methylase
MSKARSAEQFFEDYARDFDAIYGRDRGTIGRALDAVLRRSMRLRFERTLLGCRPIEGKTVLDVGCGPGHYGVALAREGAARVVMLDPANEMLSLARDRARAAGVVERCEFVHGGFDDFRPREEFDYCVLMGLMDYMPDPRAIVRHAIELTRRTAFFSFPKRSGPLAMIRRYRYRKRTALYMYGRQQLRDIFASEALGHFTLVRLARDYFVTVDASRARARTSS